MNRNHGPFGHGLQAGIGDHDSQFDDAVAVGIETGHLHVQPDEVVLVLCHNRSGFPKARMVSHAGAARFAGTLPAP